MTMMRFKELYASSAIPELRKQFGYSNDMQVPRLLKVVLSMGVGSSTSDSKAMDFAVSDLKLISSQQPVVTVAKKSISNFKLRVGVPIGCKVTLRRDRMFDFLERLVMIALPRVRDFRGISPKSFDGKGNLNIGIKEHIVFSEINYDKVDKIKGLNVTIVTSASSNEEAKALLEKFHFPFI